MILWGVFVVVVVVSLISLAFFPSSIGSSKLNLMFHCGSLLLFSSLHLLLGELTISACGLNGGLHPGCWVGGIREVLSAPSSCQAGIRLCEAAGRHSRGGEAQSVVPKELLELAQGTKAEDDRFSSFWTPQILLDATEDMRMECPFFLQDHPC